MTDKELLELAAKAANVAGIDGVYPIARDSSGDWYEWNPLTDDGDALRLAVKLEMELDFSDDETSATKELRVRAVEYHEGDPYAATRRAIVRAAAEIEIGRAHV